MNKVPCNELVVRPVVKGSVVRDATCRVSLLTFLLLAPSIKLDHNPRRPRVTKVVREMLASLRERPASFGREHPGICIAVDGLTKCADTSIDLAGDLQVFNGGHSTLALILHALGHDGSKSSTNDFDRALVEVQARCKNSDFVRQVSEMSVEVPLHIYYAADSSPDTVVKFAAELRILSKNANTSAALTQLGMAEASGVLEPLKRLVHTPIPLLWYDNQPKASARARSICCSLLGTLIVTYQDVFPAFKKVRRASLTAVQCICSPGKCSDSYRILMGMPGVMDTTTTAVLDTRVESLISLLQDMLEVYDCVGKWFVTFFDTTDPRKRKYATLIQEASEGKYEPQGAQCPFGFHRAAEEIVPKTIILLVTFGFRKLIRFNSKTSTFEWIIKPQSLFYTPELRSVLATQLKTLMRSIRELIPNGTMSSFSNTIRKKDTLSLMAEEAIENVIRVIGKEEGKKKK